MPTDNIEVVSGVIQIMRDGEVVSEFDVVDSPIIDFEFERRDSMTRIEKFCELVGIEMEQKFKKERDGDLYKLALNSYFYRWDNNNNQWEEDDTQVFSWLIGGGKPINIWTPDKYETYYFPDFMDESGVGNDTWIPSDRGVIIRDRVGIYKTFEEAEQAASNLGWIRE